MDYLDIIHQNGYDFSARIVALDNCPPHIHDAFEFYLILNGEIEVSSTAFQYPLKTGDVFIINVKEMHRIRKLSDANTVLVIQIDPYKLLTIFPKLDFYWFVCDSYASDTKDDKKLSLLREYMVLLFTLINDSKVSLSIEIHDALSQLIMHLINNFQNFTLGKNGYRRQMARENDSSIQERLFLIQEYIHANYRGKITLEGLGKYLNLSPFYVSHLIKSATGISFSDLLSLIRSERSEFLLLSSNMPIEQVSYECGFSAVRYYEKHFSRWFKMKPSAYRASLHLETHSILPFELELTEIESLLGILEQYLPRKTKSLITTESYFIDFDMNAFAAVRLGPSSIKISGISNLASFTNKHLLKQMIADLRIHDVELRQLFQNKDSAKKMSSDCATQIADLILFFMEQTLYVRISLSVADISKQDSQDFISVVLKLLEESRPNSSSQLQVVVEHNDSVDADVTALLQLIKPKLFPYTVGIAAVEEDTEENQLTYNSQSLVPRIISQAQRAAGGNGVKAVPELFDVISTEKSDEPITEIFNGIISNLGEKKPTYYAWRFLAQMGGNLIFSKDGIMVTKTGNQTRILLFHPDSSLTAFPNTNTLSVHQFNLNLSHFPCGHFLCAEFTISNDNSLYAHLSNLQFPLNLSGSFIDYLNQASEPSVEFRKIDFHETASLTYELSSYQAKLIVLQTVE